MDISNRKVVIATHYFVYGAPQALRDYLLQKKVSFLFIAHPLFVDQSRSYIEYFESGKTIKKRGFPIRPRIPFLNYAIELVLTTYWVATSKNNYDLFFGVDSLNAFAGLLLKRAGLVKKVVYYTIDYVPNRFNNGLLNTLYHNLDKFCLSYADETWNVSSKVAEGREKIRHLPSKKYDRQKVVPIGIWYKKNSILPIKKIKRHQLIFVGYLAKKQGVQTVLDAIPRIVEKIPDFHFRIVGGGEYEKDIKLKATKMDLNEYVTFYGWEKDRHRLEALMKDSAVSIALYNRKYDTFTRFADPTKLKDYLSFGIPIILTDVPHNAYDIQKNKCGIVVRYNSKEIADAIIKLMTDEVLLEKYRKNASRYIRQYDWGIIFDRALESFL